MDTVRTEKTDIDLRQEYRHFGQRPLVVDKR